MIVMASRSSTTASVSRKVRSAAGRAGPTTASTARANAMSVAVGIAQPRGVAAPAPVDQDVQQRRHGHAADRRGDRDGGPPGVAQVAGDELALELEPGDEEEDRQQAVRRPRRPGSGRRCSACGPTRCSRSDSYAVGPRGVGPDERDDRSDQQQGAADRLLAEDVGDPRRLRPGAAAEQPEAGTAPAAAHRTTRVLIASSVRSGPARAGLSCSP